jgi:hypothetical protein
LPESNVCESAWSEYACERERVRRSVRAQSLAFER